jgi:uncharacterized protein (DUF58 family)
MTPFDAAAVARASAGVSLRLPRLPQRGRLGDRRSNAAGSSLELHDFRQYHPGDDVRHLDWNAVARTGELVVRVRQEEVSPRLEVLLDLSKSMAVSEEKSARCKEIAAWLCHCGARAGLEVVLLTAGAVPRRCAGVAESTTWLMTAACDGVAPFESSIQRLPALRPSGLRVVVSDFLFEATPSSLAERWARHTTQLALIQVLDGFDVEPSVGVGARLTDAESGEAIERVLTDDIVQGYLARLAAHQRAWQAAAVRVRAQWLSTVAEASVEVLARRELASLVVGS